MKTSMTPFHLITLHQELVKGPYNHAHHCEVFKEIQAPCGEEFKKRFARLDNRAPLDVFSEAIKDESNRKRISKIFLQIVDTRLSRQKKD